MNTKYLTSKEIWRLLNIPPHQLKYYRTKGYLKNIVWTPGRGKPLYHVDEVKEAFRL